MKYFLLFLLLVAPQAHGQARERALLLLRHATAEPSQNVNTIVLHTADSAAAAYSDLARVLRADGFFLERTNPAWGAIDTGTRRVGGVSVVAAFRFIVVPASDGAFIVVQGTYDSADSPRDHAHIFAPVGNVGLPGSAPQVAWAEMVRACLLYPHSTLAYADSHKGR